MNSREVKPGVRSVGAVDWDRRLFDALIPLPEGTSYNSYLVAGEKSTVLCDTVDPSMKHVLLEQLANVQKLDYVVIHHAEQDHSGCLAYVLERFPEAKVLCSAKAVELLGVHLGMSEDRLTAVQDGEELDIGGRTLRFLYTPWAHWPETMSTYIPESRLLLSCDLFGSHLATSELFAGPEEVGPAAKRYFAEIMMPFRPALRKNLQKVEALDIDMIAPSHGPVHSDPRFIIDAYKDWVDGAPRNLVLVPYVTMHGSTAIMVERLVKSLIDRGVGVERVDISSVDLGRLATLLVDAATIVVATPTVLTNVHPAMIGILYLANALRPKVKYLSAMVTYGWASNAIETITSMTSGLKAEIIPPVLVRGLPGPEQLEDLDRLAAMIAAKHAEAGLLP